MVEPGRENSRLRLAGSEVQPCGGVKRSLHRRTEGDDKTLIGFRSAAHENPTPRLQARRKTVHRGGHRRGFGPVDGKYHKLHAKKMVGDRGGPAGWNTRRSLEQKARAAFQLPRRRSERRAASEGFRQDEVPKSVSKDVARVTDQVCQVLPANVVVVVRVTQGPAVAEVDNGVRPTRLVARSGRPRQGSYVKNKRHVMGEPVPQGETEAIVDESIGWFEGR